MFQPNDPRINRKGRPKGSKDEKWKSAQAVWDLLMKEWDSLSPAVRAGIARDIFKLHFERAISHLPKDSSDSVMSANKLMAELKALENPTVVPESAPKESELSSESNRIEHPKTDNG